MKPSRVAKTLHFDLGFVATHQELVLEIGGQAYALSRHTEQTLRDARAGNAALRLIPDAGVSHMARDVLVSQDAPTLAMVFYKNPLPGQTLRPMASCFITLPDAALRDLHAERLADNHANAHKPDPKLAFYGVEASLATHADAIADLTSVQNAIDTAHALVFQHNELLNNSSKTAALVLNYIKFVDGINAFAEQLYQQMTAFGAQPSATNNWVNQAHCIDRDNKPTPNTFKYAWSATTKTWAKAPISNALNLTKNAPELQSSATMAGCYSITPGVVSVGVEAGVATATPGSDTRLTCKNLTPQGGLSIKQPPQLSGGQFSLVLSNHYLRWLGVFVEFLGPDGKPIVPQGWSTPAQVASLTHQDTATQKIAAELSAVDTVLGIPTDSSDITVQFAWPANASAVRIKAGGLGAGLSMSGQGVLYGAWETPVCILGTVMTAIFNMAIPTLCLVAGVAIPSSSLEGAAETMAGVVSDFIDFILDGILAQALDQPGEVGTLLMALADLIVHLVLEATQPIAEKIAAIVSVIVMESVGEKAVPIVGWIATAIDCAGDLAALTETAVEVLKSPAVYQLAVTDTIAMRWELLPDVRHGDQWPLQASEYQIEAVYQCGTKRQLVRPGTLSPPQSGPIQVSLADLPAQAQVKFRAVFTSASGWLAGQVETDWMAAVGNQGSTLVLPATHITENQVPLTTSTQYEFDKRLAYDAAKGTRSWSAANGPPTATAADLNGQNDGPYLAALWNIGHSLNKSVLGYAYMAANQQLPLQGGGQASNAQMSVFRTISSGGEPDTALKFVSQGAESSFLRLVLNPEQPATGARYNFYLDDNDGLGAWLRPVQIGEAGTFEPISGKSLGRFLTQIDACIYHRAGYAVGISTAKSSLQIIDLSAGVLDDAQAPVAQAYLSYGVRPGLLHGPVAVAPARDSAIIVLEDATDFRFTNQSYPPRLQAFDLAGNPAPIFANDTSVAALRAEQAPVRLLDLAVESTGYIYVLKVVGDDGDPANYRLDIYRPDGSFLSQTRGVTTARMTVDLWRTLYGLDYGQLSKGANARPEPSISIWLPSLPSA